MEENSGKIQKRRRRRKRRKSSTMMVFVIALTFFANQICDINSTPMHLQGATSSNELTDNQQQQQQPAASVRPHDRILVEPQDTVALLGQPTDLTCIIEQQRQHNSASTSDSGSSSSSSSSSPVWYLNRMAMTRGFYMNPPFDRRFSLPAVNAANLPMEANSGSPPDNNILQLQEQSNNAGSSSQHINYTLHISQVLPSDDQTSFVCQFGTKSRPARLSVWQPPTRASVVAKIVEAPFGSSSANDNQEWPATLLAAVVPEKQPSLTHTGQQQDMEQITRILVRQNTRLRLECSSDSSKPEPKLTWLDHLHRPVNLHLLQQGTLISPLNQSTTRDDSEQLDLIEPNTLVWSFTVQQHHNDHILTCQADHPVFQDANPKSPFAHLFNQQPRHRVRLVVHFEPEIGLTKDRAQLYENQPVRFHCDARARPNLLTYQWYIDDQKIQNATGTELQISSLTRQMNGREIRCQVANEIGVNSARLKLSINYAPAFVTHLLPQSLQPQYQQPHEWDDLSSGSGSGSKPSSSVSAVSRHEIVLARQLALGVEPNQDVELRCDFDGHPRVQQAQWFRLASDYNIMGNVTPDDSDGIIQGGALYASFKSSTPLNLLENSPGQQQQQQMIVDYEQMSLEELAMIGAHQQSSSNSSSQPMLEQIQSQPPTLTNTFVYEPLSWTVHEQAPISPNHHNYLHHQHHQLQQLQQQQQQQLYREPKEPPITTLRLGSRSFSSEEINSPSPTIHLDFESKERLRWRSAEVSSTRLLLKKIDVDSVGKYICQGKILGPDGQVQQTVARAVYLVLREKPRIISHPVQEAQIGQKQISIECIAQINTVVDNSTKIQWFKDGRLIEETTPTTDSSETESNNNNNNNNKPSGAGGRNISIIVERSPDFLFIRSRLRIRQPKYNDFGIYNCTISNSFGVPDSMAINLQPMASTGLLFRAIAAIGILFMLILACAITCLLAFSPQRRKLAANSRNTNGQLDDQVVKVKSSALSLSISKPINPGDQLDSAAPTASLSSSSHHGSDGDTDSLRKSQASSSDHPLTCSEGPTGGHLDHVSGLHLQNSQQHQQQACHYMQLNGQPQPQHHHHQLSNGYLNHHQRQLSQSHQIIYHQQPMSNATGWSSIDTSIDCHPTTNGHYQMPSSLVAPANLQQQQQQQPPPLPPPPTKATMMQLAANHNHNIPSQPAMIMMESPYVSNNGEGKTYYATTTANGHYETTTNMPMQSQACNTSSGQSRDSMMVTIDGEAQFESQYGSMISNAYRALGYSTTSSPSSGGGSITNGATAANQQALPVAAVMMTIGGGHHHHNSTGSTSSSSPNSITTYHNVHSGGYISTLSSSLGQHEFVTTTNDLLASSHNQSQHSPPSSDDIQQQQQQLPMKTTSDNHHKQQKLLLHESENHLAANINTMINNNNGLATHV